MFLSPCVVDPSLTQDPERNSHTPQELIPKLQVAGIPQIHPEHRAHGQTTEKPQHRYEHTVPEAGSPQGQLVNVLFFNIKLTLRVA